MLLDLRGIWKFTRNLNVMHCIFIKVFSSNIFHFFAAEIVDMVKVFNVTFKCTFCSVG